MQKTGFYDSNEDNIIAYGADDFNAFLDTLFTDGVVYNNQYELLDNMPFYPSIAEFAEPDAEPEQAREYAPILEFNLGQGRAFYMGRWIYDNFSAVVDDGALTAGYEHIWAATIIVEYDDKGVALSLVLVPIHKAKIANSDRGWFTKAKQNWSDWLDGFYEYHDVSVEAHLLAFFYVYSHSSSVKNTWYDTRYMIGNSEVRDAAQWAKPKFILPSDGNDTAVQTTNGLIKIVESSVIGNTICLSRIDLASLSDGLYKIDQHAVIDGANLYWERDIPSCTFKMVNGEPVFGNSDFAHTLRVDDMDLPKKWDYSNCKMFYDAGATTTKQNTLQRCIRYDPSNRKIYFYTGYVTSGMGNQSSNLLPSHIVTYTTLTKICDLDSDIYEIQ